MSASLPPPSTDEPEDGGTAALPNADRAPGTNESAGDDDGKAHVYTARQLAAIAAAECEEREERVASELARLKLASDFIANRELDQKVEEDERSVEAMDPEFRARWERQLGGKKLRGVRMIADQRMTLQELTEFILSNGLAVRHVAASSAVRDEYLARASHEQAPRIEFSAKDFMVVHPSLSFAVGGYVSEEDRRRMRARAIPDYTLDALRKLFCAMPSDEHRRRSPQLILAKKLPPMDRIPVVDAGATGRIASVAIAFPPNASHEHIQQCLQTVMTGVLLRTLTPPPNATERVVEYYFTREAGATQSAYYHWYFRWHTAEDYERHYKALPLAPFSPIPANDAVTTTFNG